MVLRKNIFRTTGGRPPKFETYEDLYSRICFYFNECDNTKQHYTLSGLALYCGFCNVQKFKYQRTRSPEFDYVVSMSILMIEGYWDRLLYTKHWRAAIYMLKRLGWNGMGYKEIKQMIEYSEEAEKNPEKKKQLVKAILNNEQIDFAAESKMKVA